MNNSIDVVLFDMNGTLQRTIRHNDEEKARRVQPILELLGLDTPPEEFAQTLTERKKAYRHWSGETLVELSEEEMWKEWMLPDFQADQVRKLAPQLNQIWHEAVGTRVIFPETQEVILQLFRRGYRLGLVSNTSSVSAHRVLKNIGVSGCFECVILSCDFGRRKPHPAIFEEAARQIGVPPKHCAYIGNHPDHDMAAARKAGLGKTVLMYDPRKSYSQSDETSFLPDHQITNLMELLEIFPPIKVSTTRHISPDHEHSRISASPVYNTSISTMWAIRNFPELSDFCLSAERLGFVRLELNHQVNSIMLNGINLNGFKVGSVHEPCPADIAMDELKNKDWQISALDETNRRKGVEAIKHSIDLAKNLGANLVVVHCGIIQDKHPLEHQLCDLFKSGQKGSQKYQEIHQKLLDTREIVAEAHLESVKKSVRELLEYAKGTGVRLGLENRYHYMDIPTPDEMGELLELSDPEHLGFIFDVGHAQAMDALDFFPRMEWLERFSSRIFATHLHDVEGINDHLAPGLGEVNFKAIAPYLPPQAYRTLEVSPRNTPVQIRAGLKILEESGCIQHL